MKKKIGEKKNFFCLLYLLNGFHKLKFGNHIFSKSFGKGQSVTHPLFFGGGVDPPKTICRSHCIFQGAMRTTYGWVGGWVGAWVGGGVFS